MIRSEGRPDRRPWAVYALWLPAYGAHGWRKVAEPRRKALRKKYLLHLSTQSNVLALSFYLFRDVTSYKVTDRKCSFGSHDYFPVTPIVPLKTARARIRSMPEIDVHSLQSRFRSCAAFCITRNDVLITAVCIVRPVQRCRLPFATQYE